jgi:hypothetical protein
VVAQLKLRKLIDCGTDLVLNLMFKHERDHSGRLFVPYDDAVRDIGKSRGIDVISERVPIVDGGTPSSNEMEHITGTLAGHLRAGRHPYVHCWGGVGRTGLVVSCFLVRLGLGADSALKRLDELRQGALMRGPSPENDDQVNFVFDWENYVRTRGLRLPGAS